MAPFFAEAPQYVTVARDPADRPAGLCIATTPGTASPVAERDPLLGPRLDHARARAAHGDALVWRDSLDLVARLGDTGSRVLAVLNTAAILRTGAGSLRFSYLPIDPMNPAAVRFAEGVGARREPDLDAHVGGRVIECHVLDHGPSGLLGLIRDQVHREAGVAVAASPRRQANADDVRDALRRAHEPTALAASPLAAAPIPRIARPPCASCSTAPSTRRSAKAPRRSCCSASCGAATSTTTPPTSARCTSATSAAPRTSGG